MGPTDETDELASLDARTAATRIRTGTLSAETYARMLIARYKTKLALNTAISFDEDYVLAQARAIDTARAVGKPLGRLAGLPFMVKDQVETLGYPTTAGTPALRNYRSSSEGAVMAAMRREGAILFAKANMHELAGGGTSSNPTFGFVRNPYDPARSPGGSSGGTAAAIAARIVPIGLGEDTGGSVRIPAGFCGIAGLRPSTWPAKLYSDSGLIPPPAPDDVQTIGPMARTVSDVALLHEAITGQTVPAAPPIAGIRIGVPAPGFWQSPYLDPAVAVATRNAFEKLGRAGAQIVEVDLDAFVALGNRLLPAVASGDRQRFAAWLEQNVPGMTLPDLVRQIPSRDVRASYETDVPPLATPPEQRRRLRDATARDYADLFSASGIDVLAFPNPLILAPPIAAGGDPVEPMVTVQGQSLPLRLVALRFEMFGSRLGVPGLNLPVGLAAGLPVGIELEGLANGDARLLAIGMAIEAALGPIAPPAV